MRHGAGEAPAAPKGRLGDAGLPSTRRSFALGRTPELSPKTLQPMPVMHAPVVIVSQLSAREGSKQVTQKKSHFRTGVRKQWKVNAELNTHTHVITGLHRTSPSAPCFSFM